MTIKTNTLLVCLKKLLVLSLLFTTMAYAEKNKLDRIIEKNKLRVCIWTNYFGISYLDQRTQKLVGIDSDLAKELAKDLNVKLEFVQSSFVTFILDVTQDRCDIAMFAIGNTKLRSAKVRFTSSHLFSDIYAITTKSNKRINTWNDIDQKGIVVAVAKGTYHEQVMKKKLKKAKLLVVNSHEERESEVQSGRVDVFMTDYPFAQRMLATKNGASRNWVKLIIPDIPYHITPYSWVMSYGNDEFYNKVEEFISKIKKDGRLLNLSKKNGLESIVKLK